MGLIDSLIRGGQTTPSLGSVRPTKKIWALKALFEAQFDAVQSVQRHQPDLSIGLALRIISRTSQDVSLGNFSWTSKQVKRKGGL